MKRIWKIVGIVSMVAILGAISVGAVAFAQDDEGASPFDFSQKFKEALAEILGISVDEYDAAVGKAQEQVVDEALAEGWLTEDQAEMLRWRLEQAPEGRMPRTAKGFPGLDKRGGVGSLGTSLTSIAADELGLSLTDLLTEMQGGKSMADLAEEKGVDTQAIVDAYLAQIHKDLDEAVAEGAMTQKQADYYLEQAAERAADRLENVWPEDMGRGGYRGGGMIDFPGMGGL